MKKKTLTLLVAIILCSLGSCGSSNQLSGTTHNADLPNSTNGDSFLTKTPDEDDVDYLCHHINELRRIPYDARQSAGDRIYDGLKRSGRKAVPCLIDRITDLTPMKDPGPGPIISDDYKVGDSAVFMLMIITGEPWQPETMFTPEYSKRWSDDGLYVYFDFVSKPAHRKHLQEWWRKWSDKKQAYQK